MPAPPPSPSPASNFSDLLSNGSMEHVTHPSSGPSIWLKRTSETARGDPPSTHRPTAHQYPAQVTPHKRDKCQADLDAVHHSLTLPHQNTNTVQRLYLDAYEWYINAPTLGSAWQDSSLSNAGETPIPANAARPIGPQSCYSIWSQIQVPMPQVFDENQVNNADLALPEPVVGKVGKSAHDLPEPIWGGGIHDMKSISQPQAAADFQNNQMNADFPDALGTHGSFTNVDMFGNMLPAMAPVTNVDMFGNMMAPALNLGFSMPQPVAPRVSCMLCMETFTRISDLERHHQSVHLGIRYHCIFPGCKNNRGKGYCRAEKLKSHERKVHGLFL